MSTCVNGNLKGSASVSQLIRNWPGAGRLAGMLEGLMVTVQHKHDGSQQLVHPLQAEDTEEEGV